MSFFKNILPKTLKSKLLIAFFSIGFFPYLLMLIYSHNLGEEKILQNTLRTEQAQMHQVKTHIETQLSSLGKELHFLASLDMMNDMIVGDVDKRISQLLLHKQKDLDLDISLFTLDLNQKIIASSLRKTESIFKYKEAFQKSLKEEKGYFFTEKSLMLFSPIISSMQKDQVLGYLCLSYSFSNFKTFTRLKKGMSTMLYHHEQSFKVGEVYEESLLSVLGEDPQYIGKEYLVIQEKFEGLLSGWSMVTMLKKSVALKFLDDFIFLIWGLLALGFAVIALLSLWISKRIVEPIAKLSHATKAIIATKDYSTQVPLSSDGEIAELTHDFNVMVKETQHAFEVLEEENKLRLLLAQTEEVSQAKSSFISLMSHELRTPLHTILSAAQYLIGYENLSLEQQTKVATMETSAHHLLGMINDILDLAQIEAGKVLAKALWISTEEVESLIDDILMMLGVLAEQKEIDISVENQVQQSQDVYVDITLLKQIIINLLSNAIKFTDEGSIKLVLKSDKEHFYIEIQDSGIGISKEAMQHLFEDFSQVKQSKRTEKKGSGLGLAISRKLAALFDAEVTLESKGEGEGSKASIKVKIQPIPVT